MADRIIAMRERLYNLLVELKTPGDWGHIKSQIGEQERVLCRSTELTLSNLYREDRRLADLQQACSHTLAVSTYPISHRYPSSYPNDKRLSNC
jgi:aspartate aminotransferase